MRIGTYKFRSISKNRKYTLLPEYALTNTDREKIRNYIWYIPRNSIYFPFLVRITKERKLHLVLLPKIGKVKGDCTVCGYVIGINVTVMYKRNFICCKSCNNIINPDIFNVYK